MEMEDSLFLYAEFFKLCSGSKIKISPKVFVWKFGRKAVNPGTMFSLPRFITF